MTIQKQTIHDTDKTEIGKIEQTRHADTTIQNKRQKLTRQCGMIYRYDRSVRCGC